MWFKVDLRSPDPIYHQIQSGIKELIMRGEIKEGETLPSIRDMASFLRVNPNTVVRAYRELETDGLVFARPGMGYLVVQSPQEIRESMKEGIKPMIQEIFTKARKLGMDYHEFLEVAEQLWKTMK